MDGFDLPVCLLLDSTNQHPGRSYTCSVRDTIDQRQTTFPSIRFMQKHGWAMKMTFNWRSYDISWNRQMIGGSVHLLLASNVAKTRSFWRYSVIKICLFISFSTVFRMQYLVDNLFLLSCCIVEDPENASADTFYSDSLHVWSRNHSTTRHYCPINKDTFLKQGISCLQSTPFFGKLFVSVMIAVRMRLWHIDTICFGA